MRILFLSTWFPYPPNQGGKIRAFNLINALAARHQVALVSFQDVQIEEQWLQKMQKVCERVEIVKHDPFQKDPKKRLAGWLSTFPSDVVASYSLEMERTTMRVAEEWKPDLVVALTFVTACYALKVQGPLRVVDVDNLMTRLMEDAYQQANSAKEQLRRFLALWKFRRYERWLYRQFDLCLSVTSKDQQRMTELFDIPVSKLGVVPNGAFIEENENISTSPQNNTLIFNGALTYQANFDAMDYFLRDIFPLICSEKPEVSLKITGSTKGVPLHLLPQYEQVEFTGFLDDIKPVVASSWACVVPLRIGGGTRLKILEAMSLGTPVVSTGKGAEGLDVLDGVHLLLADTAEQFSRQTIRLLNDECLRQKLSIQARQLVAEKYDWQCIRDHFAELVEACERNHNKAQVK